LAKRIGRFFVAHHVLPGFFAKGDIHHSLGQRPSYSSLARAIGLLVCNRTIC